MSLYSGVCMSLTVSALSGSSLSPYKKDHVQLWQYGENCTSILVSHWGRRLKILVSVYNWATFYFVIYAWQLCGARHWIISLESKASASIIQRYWKTWLLLTLLFSAIHKEDGSLYQSHSKHIWWTILHIPVSFNKGPAPTDTCIL